MGTEKLRVRVFLSHKYEAFAVNRYFYGLLTAAEHEVQFEVDEGTQDGKKVPSNVTRIERKIREADAFVGIYPLPDELDASPSVEDLRKQSRYFRLELDIARRVGLPIIVFSDRRYAKTLNLSSAAHKAPFDSRELPDDVTNVAEKKFRRAIGHFYEDVEGWVGRGGNACEERQVGMVLSDEDYDASTEDLLKKALVGWDVRRLPWPPQLQAKDYAELDRFDWLVLDCGRAASLTGIVPYIHACAIPTMRVRRVASEEEGGGPEEAMMFGGLEIGYADPRKQARWQTPEQLVERVTSLNEALKHPATLIPNAEEAARYFRRAADVEVNAFLSCAGADIEFAARLAAELKKRFNDAFYYKHPGDLTPGSEWMTEIAEKIDDAQVGIILHSRAWLESGYCEYERDQMIRRRADHALELIPVKLTDNGPKLHKTMSGITYVRTWDPHTNTEKAVDTIADEIVAAYRKLASKKESD